MNSKTILSDIRQFILDEVESVFSGVERDREELHPGTGNALKTLRDAITDYLLSEIDVATVTNDSIFDFMCSATLDRFKQIMEVTLYISRENQQ